jgi:hypothetical protein
VFETRHIGWITFLAAAKTLLLASVAVAQKPVDLPPPSLIVKPLTGLAVSGTQGGPFSPAALEYRISSSTGTVNYSVRTPS